MPKRSMNCQYCKPHYDDENKRRARIENTEYVRAVLDRQLRQCVGPKCAAIFLV